MGCLPFLLLSHQTLGIRDRGRTALPHLTLAASCRYEILLNYHKLAVVLVAEFTALGILWLFLSLSLICVAQKGYSAKEVGSGLRQISASFLNCL